MDERSLIRIIGENPRAVPRRGWNCPSEIRVAAYLEQHLEPKEKARFEAHLADCDFCLGLVSAIVRQQRLPKLGDVPDSLLVPESLLEEAAKAVPAKIVWSVSLKWILAPVLAGFLVVGAIFLRPRHGENLIAMPHSIVPTQQPAPQVTSPSSSLIEKQYVRKLSTSTPKLLLLEPRPGSVVRREALRFRWKPATNAVFYKVRVLDEEGALVWQAQESANGAELPAELALRPGKYFVLVNAYLKNGRSVKSDSVEFRIETSS